jgi:hypothetical protein
MMNNGFCRIALTLFLSTAPLRASDYQSLDARTNAPHKYCFKEIVCMSATFLLAIPILVDYVPTSTEPDQEILPGDPCYSFIARLNNDSATIEPTCAPYPYIPAWCNPPITLEVKQLASCKEYTKCYSDERASKAMSNKCMALNPPHKSSNAVILGATEMRTSGQRNVTEKKFPKERIADIRKKFKEARAHKK